MLLHVPLPADRLMHVRSRYIRLSPGYAVRIGPGFLPPCRSERVSWLFPLCSCILPERPIRLGAPGIRRHVRRAGIERQTHEVVWIDQDRSATSPPEMKARRREQLLEKDITVKRETLIRCVRR